MFASLSHPRARRRGVVLIVVLGMLALLALIGVTFATFSGQARTNARNFSQSQNGLDVSEVMDYALAQLIEDTANPQSSLRGHSLKRDMYGNDAAGNGYLPGEIVSGNPLYISSATLMQPIGTNPNYQTINGRSVNVTGLYQCVTNLPGASSANYPAYYGYDFTRWIMTFSLHNQILINALGVDPSFDTSPYFVSTTYEVVFDDYSSGSNRIFYVGAPTTTGTTGWANIGVTDTTAQYASPVANMAGNSESSSQLIQLSNALSVSLLQPINNQSTMSIPFTLDGRFLRAFNGTGLGSVLGAWGNFKVNGSLLYNYGVSTTNPVTGGSYDITTGISSGGCMGIPDAIGMDEDYDACDLDNWFLAIQSADGQVIIPSFHRPGIIRVDTSGNGGSYASGSSNQLMPVSGTQPTDYSGASTTQLYNDWRSTSADSAARFLRPRWVDGHSQVSFPDLYPDATGKITYDVDNDGDGVTDSVWLDLGYPAIRNSEGDFFKPLFAFMVIGLNGRMPLNTAGNLQLRDINGVALGLPASHLGYSPSEIDPIYALAAPDPNKNPTYSLTDNAGVPVNVTQVRNLLTGTVPPDLASPLVYYPSGTMLNYSVVTNSAGTPVTPTNNHDANLVPFGIDIATGNPLAYYLPNNIADPQDIGYTAPNPPTSHASGVTRTNGPVAGRWGEVEYMPMGSQFPLNEFFNNPIRAGQSYAYANSNAPTMVFNYNNPPYPVFYRDADDDNFNTFDPYPSSAPETGDYRDAAGAWSLPIERWRRFTTPLDTAGDGTMHGLSSNPLTNTIPTQADAWGRMAYYKYFRPPGVPNVTPGATPFIPDDTTNVLHGFDSARSPSYGPTSPLLWAAMPYDLPYTGTQPNYTAPPMSPLTPPAPYQALTMDNQVNSIAGFTNAGNVTPFSSPALNEADEMRVYQVSPLDQAFQPSDLEWLYRLQDVDGITLQSRLAYLAPISFTNQVDGLRRRRMFSIDTWETTNFVWANDAPNANFASGKDSLGNVIVSSSFINPGYANNVTVINNTADVNKSDYLWDNASLSSMFNNAYYTALAGGQNPPTTPAVNYTLPSLAHRDRKINLNYPLPVSTDPYEPIRQKWITESYQLLLNVLPPASVDTAQERAQLSQFLVNVIDFRDTDATMTHFTSPDVVLQVPSGAPAGSPMQPVLKATATAPFYNLDQFGMEYNPVAINEVLAYSYQHRTGAAGSYQKTPAFRFFVELVNTLSQSQDPSDNVSTAPTTAGASKLDLGNWDMVILPDTNAANRPDPTTGNLPIDPATSLMGPTAIQVDPLNITMSGGIQAYGPILLGNKNPTTTMAFTQGSDVILYPLGTGGTPTLNPVAGTATTLGKNYYYVIGNYNNDTTGESDPPLPTNASANSGTLLTTPQVIQTLLQAYDPFDLSNYVTSIPRPANSPLLKVNGVPPITTANATFPVTYTSGPTGQSLYYWLCLRRPANPLAQTSPINPMVVVDSMRFPYIDCGIDITTVDKSGTGMDVYSPAGTTANTPDLTKANAIYSAQRIQPYRGGHAVKVQGSGVGTNPAQVDPNYGYSEQTASYSAGAMESNDYPKWGTQNLTRYPIAHTLGWRNDPNNVGTPENWDFFPFHDRDFNSVAELMLVPGCPPGLFTKQFVEVCPSSTTVAANKFPIDTPSPSNSDPAFVEPGANGNFPTTAGNPLGTAATLTFPYLSDNFFYSSPNKSAFISPSVTGSNGPLDVFYKQGSQAAASGTPPADGSNPNGMDTAGWYKMFEFFEVPSPALGAIAEVSSGNNYDWARQDTRPGQLNINLIIDEEVFLGLMGNAGLANELIDPNTVGTAINFYPYQVANNALAGLNTSTGFTPPALNGFQMLAASLPQVVTMAAANPGTSTTVSTNLGPAAYYQIPNQGFFTQDPFQLPTNATDSRIKAAFSDFLKLRHGGSGFLFAWGSGQVGQLKSSGTNLWAGPVDAERPFHSLSYPDIDYTVMRPAFLPPSAFSMSLTQTQAMTPLPMTAPLASGNLVWDPGVRNPFLIDQSATVKNPLPPVIPVRRLFQRPDNASGNKAHDSNADFNGDPYVNDATGSSSLSKIYNNLTTPIQTYPDLTSGDDVNTTAKFGNSANLDYNLKGNTRHPYFRSEWMQKVTNLTTVRTHQYAVWITVGFFAVIKQGDPILADTLPIGSSDILGEEIGLLSGKSVRYRAFFIVDRTKAVGFNQQQPGNFRDCVLYRSVIE